MMEADVTIIEPNNTAEENAQAIEYSITQLTLMLKASNQIAEDSYVENPWKDVKWPDKGEYAPKVHKYHYCFD
ncbi:hypothetical protein HMPREF1092_00886 [Clostridium thermobutyricum]|uniref:Uncharacterized protein n=1 Tax=Clostridium thermobutyricum TaxID=29372 RepID=N9Y1F2_9CLOT|nr:hypothetical protein [Clostridium thermobutyricum]ENZ01652.1 hypothetical protein HMPREF1092_00886 [Clostridium thermobutyricum]